MRRIVLALLLALAPAAAGAEQSLGDLKGDLRKALAAADAKRIGAAIAGFRAAGGAEAVTYLMDMALKLESRREESYWLLVEGSASFGDTPALEAVGAFIVKRSASGTAQDLLFALGRNRLSTVCAALIPVMHDAPEPLALTAIRQLAAIRVPPVVDALIARLKAAKEDQVELRRRVVHALTHITGERLGDSAANWETWWSRSRDKPLTGVAREGRTTGTAIDDIDDARAEQIIGLEKLPKRRIVVIRGECVDAKRFDHNFDHIEHLLAQMGLPHTVITKEDFEAGFQLNESMVVCINCTMWREHCVCPTCKSGDYTGDRLHRCTGCNVHDPRKYDFKPGACERLKRFVEAGGYLFTEDWVLEELLVKNYPDLLGDGPKLKESNVKVLPGPGAAAHPYMEGVFRDERSVVVAKEHGGKGKTAVATPEEDPRTYYARSKHAWQIDLDSPPIVLKNKRGVTVLLQSPELGRMARGNDAVAITFRPGAGRRSGVVLHVLSHFGKQQSRDDEYGLQNLLLNFLIDANMHRGGALPKPAGEPTAAPGT